MTTAAPDSVQKGTELAATFQPPWLLSHADVQTVLGSLAKRGADLKHSRKRIETHDEDFLDVDYLEPNSAEASNGSVATATDSGPASPNGLTEASPIVVMVHGLGGSSSSQYIIHLAAMLLEKGFRPVAVNLRGSSGTPNKAQRLYHAAAYEDILHIVETLIEWHPAVSKFALVGFSLGGSITLNMMGRRGNDLPSKLVCAAAVSPPLDLIKGADALESGAGRKWTAYLLTGLRKLLQPRLESFDAPGVDAQRAYAAQTIREFDDHLIAPLHGFSGWQEYYTKATSVPFLPNIARPTLIVRSRDDPFLAPSDVDIPELKMTPNIVPVLTECGGHMGYVMWKGWFGLEAWAERTVAEWVTEQLTKDA